jgi:serine/threonine protein kinase
MKPIAPNTLIQNRYLIVHLIGKGGMGEVYLAVDQRLGSAIALKRTFFSDDATLGHAFEREARTLARLRHPVLPKVSDHFTEEGTQYLVMEHISGEDMSKRLEASPNGFPVSWVLFWADQLLDALNYLHSHEPPIVHRDIKPQNLKLTDENHIVLLDFGLSKNSVGETRVTTAGSIVGYTPHYAPMEQIRGTGTDARSDLYSLSATLYQILTNGVPPDALTRADSLINGMPDPVPPINELNPEVSKAVSDVIIKGMAISQEQRYKTAREMQKALRDAYAQLQTGMSANTVAYNSANSQDLPPSPQKTAEFSSAPSVSNVSAQNQSQPSGFNSDANSVDIHSSQTPPAGKTVTDFDQTIRYDESVPDSSPKQSDIKTEVFLAGSSSAITSFQQETPARRESYGESGDLKYGESFAAKNESDQAENYSPNATVPLISFDKDNEQVAGETAVAFDIPEYDETAANAGYVPAENYAPDEEVYAPAAAPQKSGKGLAIAGGLFALLILAVGASGIGWYMLKNNKATTEKIASPTPEASVSVEPTPVPTLEVVNDTNSSTDGNSSTNSEVANSETNSSTNSNASVVSTNPTRPPTQTAQPTPIKPAATPRSTPQVVTVKTPPVVKPTPAKTPKQIIIVQ